MTLAGHCFAFGFGPGLTKVNRAMRRAVGSFMRLLMLSLVLGSCGGVEPTPPSSTSPEELEPSTERYGAATFGYELSRSRVFDGAHEFLGYIPARTDDSTAVAAFLAEGRVFALSSDAPERLFWQAGLESVSAPVHSESVLLAPGTLVLRSTQRIVALSRENGAVLWRWSASEAAIFSAVANESKLFVVTLAAGNRYELRAFDVHAGNPLWSRNLPSEGFVLEKPLCSEDALVLLPDQDHQHVLVLRPTTGETQSEFDLESKPDRRGSEQIWIEGGLLIEPRLRKSEIPRLNRIRAQDLATGALVWSENFDVDGDSRQIQFLLEWNGERTLVVNSRSGESPISLVRVLEGGIEPVDGLGLAKGEKLTSTPSLKVVSLQDPLVLFVARSDLKSPARLKGVSLQSGFAWDHEMPIASEDLYTSFTGPVASDSTVVFAYNKWPRDAPRPTEARMRFLSRDSGTCLAEWDLDPVLYPAAYRVRLVPLGNALILCGPTQMEVLQ